MIESMQLLQDTLVSADPTPVIEKTNRMLAVFQEMDKERLNFGGASLPLQIVLGVVMFGVALGIKTQHFKDVAKNPKLVLLGFVSQFVLLPAVTFLLVLSGSTHLNSKDF